MKNSYLTAGTNLAQLVRLLRRNPVSYHPKFLLRILFLFQSAFWSTVFGYIEEKRFRKKIEASPLPVAPIFIIGHWRTGSTLLHQIMNHDPEMLTPTLFQVAEPGCFLTSYNYYKPIMKLLLRKYRPMDRVKLGMDEPQEDEYAIYRMTDHSPIERLVFPVSSRYFLRDYPDFVPAEPDKTKWEKQLLHFFRKLNFETGKTIVSKNPFNSLRIKELVSLFPDARFIHIYRNPLEVVPSTMHLWNIVQKQNCLNNKGVPPSVDDVIEYLDHFWNVIRQDLATVDKRNTYVMKFETLEGDPRTAIKDLYDWFHLPFSTKFKNELDSFLSELQGYRKNQYQLSQEEKDRITGRLSSHMEYFGY